MQRSVFLSWPNPSLGLVKTFLSKANKATSVLSYTYAMMTDLKTDARVEHNALLHGRTATTTEPVPVI